MDPSVADLAHKRIVVGMTGGVAAYKICDLVRRLQDEGADVQVVMTAAAQQFVTATTMQALTGQPVFTDQWGGGAQVGNAMPHIDLTRGVDAIVVAPATAHFIAKTAHGLADDLLSTLVARPQPCDDGAAGRSGDERRDVGQPRHPTQRRPVIRRRHHAARAGVWRPGVR